MPGKSKRGKVEGIQCEPVEVNPAACSLEEGERHMRLFIESFVRPQSRDRWRLFLIERPEKLAREWNKGSMKGLDPLCARLLNGQETFAQVLAERYGDARGVFVNAAREFSKLTVAEAASLYDDGILSLVPGKRALVFSHDGDVCLHERG